MKNLFIASFMLSIFFTVFLTQENSHAQLLQQKEGAYTVVEGKVELVQVRMLVIEGQQYPVSVFVRVFDSSLKGREIPMKTLADTGKVDKAKLYLLGGKVEKIVVIQNI